MSRLKSTFFLASFVAGGILAGSAEEMTATEEKSSSTSTNAAHVVAHVPKSVFVVPTKPEEGRNPFFPDLTDHLPYSASVETTVKPTERKPSAGLLLQGFSGTPERRLAIISNVVFGTNDVRNVGNITVRCLKINETSVVIEVGGEQRELHFQPRN